MHYTCYMEFKKSKLTDILRLMEVENKYGDPRIDRCPFCTHATNILLPVVKFPDVFDGYSTTSKDLRDFVTVISNWIIKEQTQVDIDVLPPQI